MKKKSKELRDYIEKNIFPIYQKNDKAHDINHIYYVIRRSLIFAHQLDDIDDDMVYTIAAFHDIGHHIESFILWFYHSGIFISSDMPMPVSEITTVTKSFSFFNLNAVLDL